MTEYMTSEIIIPEGVEEVFQVHCSETGLSSGILDETGAWNVMLVTSTDVAQENEFACPGEHTMRRIQL